jgi:hypothetical protein
MEPAHHSARQRLANTVVMRGPNIKARWHQVASPGLLTQPQAAGRFWPIAASIVGHYAAAWLPPFSSRWGKIGSVTAVHPDVIWL